MDNLRENRLTITMPVFERKDFFLDALNSAINQTVKCDILVIDNCSSHDYFEKICKEKNIKYIKNESNIGLFPNWNKCLKSVKTEYAMILQDDNILELEFVESFKRALNDYQNIDLYYTDFYQMDLLTRNRTPNKHVYPFGYFENGNEVIDYAIKYKLGLLYSVVIKVSEFDEYYYKFHGSNDWLWIYSNVSRFKVFGDNKKLVNYGIHDLQDSQNKDTQMKCMLTLAYIYEEVLSKKVSEKGLIKKSRRLSTNYFMVFLYITDKTKLQEFVLMDNIYSNYLVRKLKTNVLFGFYCSLGKLSKKVIYHFLIFTGFIDHG
jgi:glycosyltransferase involved in cell wall biosynthesis